MFYCNQPKQIIIQYMILSEGAALRELIFFLRWDGNSKLI